jgi:hypothetical protein|nr:MAG TPA: hypothetical protein [Herelleviridae sp.]
MNEHLNFIKFALDEISKIDDIETISISKQYGVIFLLNFEIKFKKLGSKTFQITYSISNGDKYTPRYSNYDEVHLREQIIEKVKDFKNKEITECEDKIEFYSKKLKVLKKGRENG